MLHVAALAFGLMLPTAPRVMTSRACPVVACAGADPEVAIKEAAARVVKAATRFGGAQGEAAAAWVEDATSGGAVISELIEQQLALFDECMLDDDSGKCKVCCARLAQVPLLPSWWQQLLMVALACLLRRSSMRP